MKQEFSSIRSEISVVLNQWFNQAEQSYTNFPVDKKYWQMLREFVGAGKFFRACVLVGSVGRLSDDAQNHDLAVKVGAIVEMYESGILIQDDVMDGDERRRGKLSIHQQIARLETAEGEEDTQQMPVNSSQLKMGESIATCLGDVLFFLAQLQLSKLTADLNNPAVNKELQMCMAEEMLLLGLAQTEDIRLADAEGVTKDNILNMFIGKTGRYSGRWPVELALIITQYPQQKRSEILKIADQIGLLYQLRDDYLGMFGDQQKTGKNTVSDVQQGKKTLYWWYATQLLTGNDKQLFDSIYGKVNANSKEMEMIKNLLIQKEITTQVDQEIKTSATFVFESLEKLDVPTEAKIFWKDITTLIIERDK